MKNMNNKAVTRIFTILITALLLLCIAGFVLLCVFGPDPSVLAKKEAPPTEDATYELKETFDYGEGYLRSIVFNVSTASHIGAIVLSHINTIDLRYPSP